MLKIAIIAIAAVILIAILLAILFTTIRRGIEVIGFDSVASPGESCSFRVKVERKIWPVYPDMQGVTVFFKYNGSEKICTTDKFGVADFPVTAPPKEGIYLYGFTVTSDGLPPYDGTARIFVFSPESKILITDIDKTISNATEAEFLVRSNANIHPFENAATALRELLNDYKILYVTARDDRFANKTFSWLKLHNFPEGPVYFRNVTWKTLSAKGYKVKVIAELREKWKNIVWGIGDREEDMEAYAKSGIKPMRFRKGNKGDGYPVAKTWNEVVSIIKSS